jgi:uncharacterized protein YjiS (DUF1127 family)
MAQAAIASRIEFSPFAALRKGFAAYMQERARRQQFRVTMAELRGLSDRELKDLGISRSGIKAVAMEVYYDS